MTAIALPPSGDDPLVRALRRGDARVFGLVFRRHADALIQRVARMVGSRHVAADLVHDVFLRVWTDRAALAIRGSLGGYLRRAAHNRAIDWLRRERLHDEWMRRATRESAIATAAPAEPPMERERLAELRDALETALAAMPERRRAVCELRWHGGLPPAAIAGRLGISLKTVETHITQGLKDARAAVRDGARATC